jgi:hypothetical protein
MPASAEDEQTEECDATALPNNESPFKLVTQMPTPTIN